MLDDNLTDVMNRTEKLINANPVATAASAYEIAKRRHMNCTVMGAWPATRQAVRDAAEKLRLALLDAKAVG